MFEVPEMISTLLAPLISGGLLSRRDASVFVQAGSRGRFTPLDEAVRVRAAALMPGSLRLHVSSLPAMASGVSLVCAHVFIHDGSAERDVAAAYRHAHGADPGIRLIGSRVDLPGTETVTGPGVREMAWALDPDSSVLVTTLTSRSTSGDPLVLQG